MSVLPKCYAIPTESKSPAAAAKEYSETIKKLLAEGKHHAIDIVLLGLGEDGHTASLFPGDKPLKEREALFAAAESPSGIKDRITMTAPLIENADRVMFLVTGTGKAEILHRLLEEDTSFEEYPANIYKKVKGTVTWFVDGPAASKLSTNS